MIIYLMGDSHITELATAWMAQKNAELSESGESKLVWKSLYGCGLKMLFHSSKNKPLENKDEVLKVLREIRADSCIILSYTEVDGRMTLDEGKKTRKDLLEIYRDCLFEILKVSRAKKIFVVDWYAISSEKQSEQFVTPEERVLNRKAQIDVLNKLQSEISEIEVDSLLGASEIEDENGFARPGVLRDGVHFDFSNELISKVLRPRFDRIVERSI